MPTTITGTDGVSQVQTGAVESGDLPAGSVLQVVTNFDGTKVVTNNTIYDFLPTTVTPVSDNSTFHFVISVCFGTRGDGANFDFGFKLLRDGTSVNVGTNSSSNQGGANVFWSSNDSARTGTTEYEVYEISAGLSTTNNSFNPTTFELRKEGATPFYLNRPENDDSDNDAISSIQIFEVKN